MKKLHLLFAGAFAALAIVACSDDELETEAKTETDTETEEGNTGDENTGDENTGEEEEAPQAYITLSEAELQFGKEGGETTVTVETNYDWNAEYESDWFTVVADTNAGTITVSCDANETGEVREGTVTVTAGDNSNNVAEATLTITQLAFDPESLVLEYTIDEDGTEIQLPLGEKDNYGNVFTVDCTVDWGDGSEVETVSSSFPSHTYSAGTYTVIINGKVELLSSWDCDKWSSIAGKDCLTAVKQWGDLGLKSMYCAFYECYSLTTVPEDMFSGCTAVEDFGYAFCYCFNLAAVPSFKGLSNATRFEATFYDCYSLTTVPEDMFSGCTAAEDFRSVFYWCASLETVPVGIFDNNTSVTDFRQAFEGCSNLNGESPYTMMDGNKVHLYERGNYPEYFSTPTSYSYCFTNCTGLDDYNDIPSGWK